MSYNGRLCLDCLSKNVQDTFEETEDEQKYFQCDFCDEKYIQTEIYNHMDKQHYENIMDIETTENPKHESEETLLPNSKRRKIVREESDGKYDTNNENNIDFQIDTRIEENEVANATTPDGLNVSDIKDEFHDNISIDEFSNNVGQNFDEDVLSKNTNLSENQVPTTDSDVGNSTYTKSLNSDIQKNIKSDPDVEADLEITYVKKENLEKTRVKLLIIKDNGDKEIFKICIRKASNNINLVDVKQHLMSQPRNYNNFDIKKYIYSVQTIEDGIPSWEDCDEDDGMVALPLCGDIIIIKCCFKS